LKVALSTIKPNQTNLLKTCLFFKIEASSLCRLNWQIFLTFGLYLKCGLYKIPFFFVLIFGLDRDHCNSPRNENLNLLLQIKFLNLFYIIHIYIKIEKFTGPNKVLLVLGWRTGGHREDCVSHWLCTSIDSHFLCFGKYQITISFNIIFIDIQHISQIFLWDMCTSITNFFITFDVTYI